MVLLRVHCTRNLIEQGRGLKIEPDSVLFALAFTINQTLWITHGLTPPLALYTVRLCGLADLPAAIISLGGLWLSFSKNMVS